MTDKNHWEDVYQTKESKAVSWYQPHAELSLEWIKASAPDTTARIIDVGGGASTLVDDLISTGFSQLVVLDLAEAALTQAKARLKEKSALVNWLVADINSPDLTLEPVDIWHDRAVFHFLTQPGERETYRQRLLTTLTSHGTFIIATFAEDGPTQCSGLSVMRYSAADLTDFFGEHFLLVDTRKEVHQTPFATAQQFRYCLFKKRL